MSYRCFSIFKWLNKINPFHNLRTLCCLNIRFTLTYILPTEVFRLQNSYTCDTGYSECPNAFAMWSSGVKEAFETLYKTCFTSYVNRPVTTAPGDMVQERSHSRAILSACENTQQDKSPVTSVSTKHRLVLGTCFRAPTRYSRWLLVQFRLLILLVAFNQLNV